MDSSRKLKSKCRPSKSLMLLIEPGERKDTHWPNPAMEWDVSCSPDEVSGFGFDLHAWGWGGKLAISTITSAVIFIMFIIIITIIMASTIVYTHNIYIYHISIYICVCMQI